MEGPMREEANLELDLDGEGSGRVARVTVADVEGYTREGAPTITAACDSYAALHREVERLREELDAVLEAAQTEFGGEQDAKAASTAPAEVSAEHARKPILDVTLKVGEVMTREVVTATLRESVDECVKKMQRVKCRHLPVISGGRVTGMVSMRDLLRDEIKEQVDEIENLKAYIHQTPL